MQQGFTHSRHGSIEWEQRIIALTLFFQNSVYASVRWPVLLNGSLHPSVYRQLFNYMQTQPSCAQALPCMCISDGYLCLKICMLPTLLSCVQS